MLSRIPPQPAAPQPAAPTHAKQDTNTTAPKINEMSESTKPAVLIELVLPCDFAEAARIKPTIPRTTEMNDVHTRNPKQQSAVPIIPNTKLVIANPLPG